MKKPLKTYEALYPQNTAESEEQVNELTALYMCEHMDCYASSAT